MDFGSIPFLARSRPSGGGGAISIVSSGTSNPGTGDPRTAPVPAGAAAGDRILIMFYSGGGTAVVSVTDDQSNSYSALGITGGASGDRVYVSAPIGSTAPTTITIDLAAIAGIDKADVYVLRNAGGTIANQGSFSTGFSTNPRAHNYTTTVANECVFGTIDFDGGGVTGGGSADADHTWSLNASAGYEQRFARVLATAGSYSATVAPVGAGSASTGYWFTLGSA